MSDFYPDVVGFTVVALTTVVSTVVTVIRNVSKTVSVIVHSQHVFYVIFAGLSLTRDSNTNVYTNPSYGIAEISVLQLQLWNDFLIALYQYTDIIKGYELNFSLMLLSSLFALLLIPALSFVVDMLSIVAIWMTVYMTLLILMISFCYGQIARDPVTRGNKVVVAQVEVIFSPYFHHVLTWLIVKSCFYVPYLLTFWSVCPSSVGRLFVNLGSIITMMFGVMGGLLSITKRRKEVATTLLQGNKTETVEEGKSARSISTQVPTTTPRSVDARVKTSRTPRFGDFLPIPENERVLSFDGRSRWTVGSVESGAETASARAPDADVAGVSLPYVDGKVSTDKVSVDPHFLNRAFYAGLSSAGFTGPAIVVSQKHQDLITITPPALVVEE